jgi:hypothetical protein
MTYLLNNFAVRFYPVHDWGANKPEVVLVLSRTGESAQMNNMTSAQRDVRKGSFAA